MVTRSTHSMVLLDVDPAFFTEIERRLVAAGYKCIYDDYEKGRMIDMSGLGLVKRTRPNELPEVLPAGTKWHERQGTKWEKQGRTRRVLHFYERFGIYVDQEMARLFALGEPGVELFFLRVEDIDWESVPE